MSAFEPRALPELAWPETVPHLSYSSLSMFRRCPEQFRQVYVLGQRRAPSSSLIWGRADHAAIEQDFRLKMETGEHMPVEDLMECFATKVEEVVAEESERSEVEWDESQSKDVARMKDLGTALVALYQREAGVLVQPVAVETWVEVELPGCPVPLVGKIDVLEENDIIDRKTVGRKSSKASPEQVFQGSLYQLAYPGSWFNIHQSVRARSAAAQSVSVLPGAPPMTQGQEAAVRASVVQLAAVISALYGRYGAEHPWPDGKLHTWACGYCGFRPTCFWHPV